MCRRLRCIVRCKVCNAARIPSTSGSAMACASRCAISAKNRHCSGAGVLDGRLAVVLSRETGTPGSDTPPATCCAVRGWWTAATRCPRVTDPSVGVPHGSAAVGPLGETAVSPPPDGLPAARCETDRRTNVPGSATPARHGLLKVGRHTGQKRWQAGAPIVMQHRQYLPRVRLHNGDHQVLTHEAVVGHYPRSSDSRPRHAHSGGRATPRSSNTLTVPSAMGQHRLTSTLLHRRIDSAISCNSGTL